MGLSDTIDKVIDIVKADTNLKGTYFGDQSAYSAYPVACVGTGEPFMLDENFPVIAQQTVWDEKYTVGILILQKFEDTEANAKNIITLTETMRKALRANLDLDGYCYQGELGNSKFVWGTKGDILLRISLTIVNYIKRERKAT